MSATDGVDPSAPAGARPRVDFYVLPNDDARARLKFACRLTEKAYLAGQRVLVWLADADELSRLDELLWSFSDHSFVPHEPFVDARQWAETPVLLACQGRPDEACELLLNLADTLPDCASIGRIAEVVDAAPLRRSAARERYRRYREQGINPQTHHIAAEP